jgi:hypothetical protein
MPGPAPLSESMLPPIHFLQLQLHPMAQLLLDSERSTPVVVET